MKSIEMRISVLISVLAVFVLLLVPTTWAQQAEKAPDFGSHPELEEISDELHELWREDPQIFARLAAARQAVRDWDAAWGHRPMNAARMLEGLGEEGLLPMLWALQGDDPFELKFGLRAWRTWRIGLIEAVGRLRDDRSIPVLIGIIEGSDPHGATRRAATSALGRTGDEDAISAVIDIARQDEDKLVDIIAGLGDARREVAQEFLLEVLLSSEDDEVRRVAIRSLGDWANQWAWQTSRLAERQSVGAKGRTRIINVLVDSYGDADPLLREEIEKSLQLAGASAARAEVNNRLDEVQGEEHRLYQSLADRLAGSPLR